MKSAFIFKLLGLSAVLAVLIFVFNSLHVFAGFESFAWASLVFMTGITILMYFIMHRAMAMKGHNNFLAAFTMGFAIKSLASLAFICYFIYIKPIANTYFILPFFIMYFIYTGMVVWDIWQSAKNNPLP